MFLTEATRQVFDGVEQPSPSDILSLELTDAGKRFKATFYNKDRDDYRYPSSGAYSLANAIPERRRLREDTDGLHYIFGATDHTAEVIENCWPASQLHMDVDARTKMMYLRMLRFRQNHCAETVAAFRDDKKNIPEHGLEYLSDMPLIDFQQVATYCSMDTEGYGLLMEQGTGKTYTTIARFMNQAARNKPDKPIDIYKSIIVCPKHLRMNWVDEICHFATRQGRITRLFGNKLRRSRQILDFLRFDDGDEFATLVCSYEQLVSNWHSLAMIPWNLAVIDESQAIKNRTTRRYEYMEKLRERADSRMILTGTGIANTILDLYSQLEFLGEGWSGFTSFEAFKDFYAVYDDGNGGGDGIKRLVGYQNVPFLKERLARCCFVITQEEALPDLPECVHDVVECEISPKQAETYSQVATQMAAEIEDEMGNKEIALEVNNILTKLLRLGQITSGFLQIEELYNDDGSVRRPGRQEWFNPVPKLDLLVDMIKEHPKDEKVIVWCHQVPAIELIAERLRSEGFKCVTYYGSTSDAAREKAEHDFNMDRETRVFIGNPEAGGTGLNLLGYDKHNPDDYDTDCTWNIFYAKSWSSIHYRQAGKRSHRKGTRRPVRITTMVTPDTIDETVHHRVNAKIALSNDVQDLREILNEVFEGLECLT